MGGSRIEVLLRIEDYNFVAKNKYMFKKKKKKKKHLHLICSQPLILYGSVAF